MKYANKKIRPTQLSMLPPMRKITPPKDREERQKFWDFLDQTLINIFPSSIKIPSHNFNTQIGQEIQLETGQHTSKPAKMAKDWLKFAEAFFQNQHPLKGNLTNWKLENIPSSDGMNGSWTTYTWINFTIVKSTMWKS